PIAENVGARGSLAEFSVSQTGLLTFSTAPNLVRSVAIVSRDGTTMETVGKPEAFDSVRLSPDGRTLALALRSAGFLGIWVMDRARGVPIRFTNASASSPYPIWSPDGKEIAFASNRGGVYRMYRKSLAGNSPEQLIQAVENISQIPVAWSSNGQAILYIERPKDRYEYSLLLLPLAHGGAPIPIASPVIQSGVALSPSGRWVAFSSSESSTQEV